MWQHCVLGLHVVAAPMWRERLALSCFPASDRNSVTSSHGESEHVSRFRATDTLVEVDVWQMPSRTIRLTSSSTTDAHRHKTRSLSQILNLSINETLPRTVLTGGTTRATALVLAFFAGEVIKPFALAMSFGIVVGTFSSIYIAAPILLWIEKRWPPRVTPKTQASSSLAYLK